MSYRIGVDIGGTFTDLVLFEETNNEIFFHKVSSTPQNPEQGVMVCLKEIIDRFKINPKDIKVFIHGSTVATNTLIENKGAKTALITTEGFKDILTIGRQDRPKLYDFFIKRSESVIPPHLRFEIPERILYTGKVLKDIDKKKIKNIINKIKHHSVKSLSVCLLHSYANSVHEKIIKDIIEKELPDIYCSLSCDILPEFKEYQRMSTTAINAYVQPVMANYIDKLNNGLKSMGIASGLYIMQSNGGIMTSQNAQEKPINTFLSGPAAGVQSAVYFTTFKNIITIDMGGTSFDVCLAPEGKPKFAKVTEINSQPIKVPHIDIHTIGAGGGSIARVDKGGALCVGPQSAGANPGPACYCRGGTEPTVTDANLVLGRLNPEYFLGGRIKIDIGLAREAIKRIADILKISVEDTAEGIIKIVNANMIRGIRFVSVERGHDPREFSLFCFGGNGPMHASEIAAELCIPEIIVPIGPGVNSAFGLLNSDFRHDYVKSYLKETDGVNINNLNRIFDSMEELAYKQLKEEGILKESIKIIKSFDMRYAGQGYELETFISDEKINRNSLENIIRDFHNQHFKRYGYDIQNGSTEIVNLRLVAVSTVPKPLILKESEANSNINNALKDTRKVYLRGKWHDFLIYDRDKLNSGNMIKGPAIIEQMDSTTFLLPEQDLKIDEYKNMIITFRSNKND
ncbi:MAG: hydantoinase/oxoprolinase family protein [Actinobacteria bacterium]|nr:hydantoinase/oxoprolinase family protein [Actinomycetota bacterium]